MDAFTIVCGFAGISPDYFYYSLDFNEYLAIGEAYKNSWEQTRVIASAFGAEIKLPWDNQPAPKRPGQKKPKYNSAAALNVAAALAKKSQSKPAGNGNK